MTLVLACVACDRLRRFLRSLVASLLVAVTCDACATACDPCRFLRRFSLANWLACCDRLLRRFLRQQGLRRFLRPLLAIAWLRFCLGHWPGPGAAPSRPSQRPPSLNSLKSAYIAECVIISNWGQQEIGPAPAIPASSDASQRRQL